MNMETREMIDVKMEKVISFEARIADKNGRICQTITTKTIEEAVTRANVWLLDSNYSLVSLEKVERKLIAV